MSLRFPTVYLVQLIVALFTIAATSKPVFAQELYQRSFGNSANPAVIFLHGGPGYNCASFEFTTAQTMADSGFFVIVYDRRGEGRSADADATFTFQQTFVDLISIYNANNVTSATLIGHSFGGIVATLFCAQHPEMVANVVLVGAPVSLQESFRTIQAKAKSIYTQNNDTTNLKYISMLEGMDTTQLEYSSYSFMHAMSNGFYTPKVFSEGAKQLYKLFRTNPTLMKYASQMTHQPPRGFWENERYTTIDLTPNISEALQRNVNFFGLYGKEDGLYSKKQISQLTSMLGSESIRYVDNCSHSVFIDQQELFINSIKLWTINR